ncbi:MAG: Crp/Fnr family transcriptional regulator [Alphaproteobacteria bacterium]|nr:Crp/Fnr family transcriptional regulator [Alphaproteobacteria bacterium]
MKTDHQLQVAIKDSILFRDSSDAFISKIAAKGSMTHYKKGKILFVHEDQAKRFFLVKNGWVKLFRETLDGEQAVVDMVTSGQTFGEAALFQDNIYTYSAEAIEASDIISIPLSLLQFEIDNNPKFVKTLLFYNASIRQLKDKEIEHRSLQNASQRIGCFMLRLVDQEKLGKTNIHLPYDKMFVAAKLGMKPETFSRALKRLKKDTKIRVKGATIEIDNLQQLSDYACRACSFEFPCADLKKD